MCIRDRLYEEALGNCNPPAEWETRAICEIMNTGIAGGIIQGWAAYKSPKRYKTVSYTHLQTGMSRKRWNTGGSSGRLPLIQNLRKKGWMCVSTTVPMCGRGLT